MSQVKFAGNPSGTGSVTIQSPATNNTYTQTLQAGSGTIPLIQNQAFTPGVPLIENTQTVSANYTITSGSSAMSAGPVTIAAGVTFNIPAGSRWVIV